MKTKIYFGIVLMSVFITQTILGASSRCCPPENLNMSALQGNPQHITLSWTCPNSSPGCAPVNSFDVKVQVRGGGQNSNSEYRVFTGSNPLTVELDVPQGASVSWKIRSTYGNLNGLYHNWDGGILPSHWVNGPSISESGNKIDTDFNDFAINELTLLQNPVSEKLEIKINAENDSYITLDIVDVLGKVQQHEKLMLYDGSNLAVFEVASLRSGIYFVRVNDGIKSRTIRFIKL